MSVLVAMVAFLSAAGCFANRSAPPPEPARSISLRYIDAALLDDHAALDGLARDEPIATLVEPPHIRSCCAFGFNLQVNVVSVPIPLYKLRTVRGIDDLGPHEYAAGLVQFTPSPARLRGERPASENNGIVYTCRGGFLDLGHLRDHADRTLFFAPRVEALLETGGTIDLRDFGGQRRAVLEPVSKRRIARLGRRRLAVATAQWLAFQVSVWHEIGSWYGNSNIPSWPEKLSSFSLEDLYSNLLGTKLAAGVILSGQAGSEIEYDRAMTEWLDTALARLQIVSAENASAAMQAVDGIWWTSQRRLPDWKVVTRRKLDLASPLRPWLLPMAFTPDPAPEVGCASDAKAIALPNPNAFGGIPFSSHARFEVVVNDNLASNGFPFPDSRSRRITQADFPAIASSVRRELAIELGGPSDHPRRN
ncbi:MAG TPA: DUF4056 domain-containing protein [Candidatus Binatia bacterium]|nr:DUF4056 domain-containing protein [Candidatus Binatia bacterium]